MRSDIGRERSGKSINCCGIAWSGISSVLIHVLCLTAARSCPNHEFGQLSDRCQLTDCLIVCGITRSLRGQGEGRDLPVQSMKVGNLGRAGFVRDALPWFSRLKTGRNNSTDVRMKPFILGESFASGFTMAMMAKDIGIAAELSRKLHAESEGIRGASLLWNEALRSLGPIADHAAICKHLSENIFRSKEQISGSG
jgi:hypothetical protein